MTVSLPERGDYLIRGGTVVSIDPSIGTLDEADVRVVDGVIEAVGPGISADGAEVIEAADMLVMPGLIDSHFHMWSSLGRNFVSEGFEYFPAKHDGFGALRGDAQGGAQSGIHRLRCRS